MSDFPEVVVVSGGTSGVGLATAIKFATAGSKVAICGRDTERLNLAHEQLANLAGDEKVLTVQNDMVDKDQAQKFIAEAIDQFQRIDLLVNNAAMAPLSPLEEMTDQTIDACINLNIRSVYYATRECWKQMKQQGSGIITNISSQAAIDPFPGFSMYGATKAWIELFTVALAGEGKEHGIRSYGIRPGAVETPMLRGLFADFPAQQCVSAQEVADAIWTVCQPAMAASSGQIIKVSRQ